MNILNVDRECFWPGGSAGRSVCWLDHALLILTADLLISDDVTLTLVHRRNLERSSGRPLLAEPWDSLPR